MFMIMYSCGLRRSEVARLKSSDIDSSRMIILVKNSKNNKDRNVILTNILLKQLRLYWKSNNKNKREWLFPGDSKDGHYNFGHINKIFKKYLKISKIRKKVSPHTLRHSWATHMLQSGINIRYLQVLMGHSSIVSTSIYTQLIDFRDIKVKSPMDSMENELFGGDNEE